VTGPDLVLDSHGRWQWLWRTAGLAGVAGAAGYWLYLIVKRQSGQPGEAALAVGGFGAAAAQVLLFWLQMGQGSRAKSVEQLAPHERAPGSPPGAA
jgi:hypothetical protein